MPPQTPAGSRLTPRASLPSPYSPRASLSCSQSGRLGVGGGAVRGADWQGNEREGVAAWGEEGKRRREARVVAAQSGIGRSAQSHNGPKQVLHAHSSTHDPTHDPHVLVPGSARSPTMKFPVSFRTLACMGNGRSSRSHVRAPRQKLYKRVTNDNINPRIMLTCSWNPVLQALKVDAAAPQNPAHKHTTRKRTNVRAWA